MAGARGDKAPSGPRERDPALTLSGLLFGPERGYCWLAIVYGVAVGLLTLAVPLCVQVLISSVANIASPRPVLVLSVVLFALLLLSGLLVAVQIYLMDRFECRFFCRMTAEIVMRNIYARTAYFETINREELANRYFEIMLVQKTLPKLLIGGTALALQATTGFVVVSSYHPFFLLFNLLLVAVLYLVLKLWAGPAVRSAVAVSDAKYRMARWLEELARANTTFKNERHIARALDRSDALSADYVDRHARHFRIRFSQIIALLLIYALASAVLLGLGGWLVILEQLSLGQLVAAELIMSVIFAGLVRFGEYLADYYGLRAALQKLAYFNDVPAESDQGETELPEGPLAVRFNRVACRHRSGEFLFDLALEPGRSYLVCAQSSRLQKGLIDLVQRYREPDGGQIGIGAMDVLDCRPQALRERIAVLDNFGVLERSIAEYLALGEPELSRSRMREVLRRVGLVDTVEALEHGLDTPLGTLGYPLSRTETLRLKLAGCLLQSPGLLIVTEIFDIVPFEARQRVLESLRAARETTLVYFSNRRDLAEFDHFVFLGVREQRVFDSLEALMRFEAAVAAGDARPVPPAAEPR